MSEDRPVAPQADVPPPTVAPESPAVAVAVSGGRDSLCLLHATLRAARPLGLRVLALHVHHGLLPEADGWVDGLVLRCRAWAREGWPVEVRFDRLAGRPGPGDSVEAWARRERYVALGRMAREGGASLVLLGHHRRDQAETVLLQAMRGAGPAGLAAMPRLARREDMTWARPWLEAGDAAIEAYAEAHALVGVEDPSNTDPRYDRSRLRRDVMPMLRAAFPQAEDALGAVARQAGEARELLAEIAAQDLAAIEADEALPFLAWHALSPARRANALRAWLGQRLQRGAPESLVRRVMGEWQGGSDGAWPAGHGLVLCAWRGELRWVRARGEEAVAAGEAGLLRIAGPGRVELPGWHGHLEVEASSSEGLSVPSSDALVLRVAPRQGGERFALQPAGLPRSLKKQYQAAGVPAWERDGPLLWRDAQLLFAPGLGVDARAWAPVGAPQWRLRWVGDATVG
jgi:tRNA(Ile)-lysidine synthase